MIGVIYAGYRTQKMNAILNVKTAEKHLQFGVTKCKSMLVSKDPDNFLNSHLIIGKLSTKITLKRGKVIIITSPN